MPELPDVEAFRRHLVATSLHRRIHGVEHVSTAMLTGVSASTLSRKLVGTSLEWSRRHGKYLFACTAGGPWLVRHFGMTGRIDRDGRDRAHTRLVLALGRASDVCDWRQFRLRRSSWASSLSFRASTPPGRAPIAPPSIWSRSTRSLTRSLRITGRRAQPWPASSAPPECRRCGPTPRLLASHQRRVLVRA
jgi:formamidopyrimidine-DNA glycosylase